MKYKNIKNMIKKLLGFLLLFNSMLTAQDSVVIKAVHDGDSYKVFFLKEKTTKWARLVSIDCPEVISNRISKHQPLGLEIGDTCRKMLLGDTVQINSYGYDRFGRLLVQIKTRSDLGNYIDLTEWLLVNGYGVYLTSPKVHPNDRILYKNARSFAKINNLGIWSLKDQLTPYQWRTVYKRKKK